MNAANYQSPLEPNESFASLTASLLARKGEAAPAVDAEAHAGVDLDNGLSTLQPAMRRPTAPRTQTYAPQQSSESGPSNIERAKDDDTDTQTFAPRKTMRPVATAHHVVPDAPQSQQGFENNSPPREKSQPASQLNLLRKQTGPVIDVAPEEPRTDERATVRPVEASSEPRAAKGHVASVHFRLQPGEFIRLVAASRKLGVSCQSILHEALDCYLDANEIARADSRESAREAARLMELMKNRRRANPKR